MTQDDIKRVLQRIIADVLGEDIQPEEITGTENLPLLDSLIVLEVVVAIEQEFHIAIDDDNITLDFLHSFDTAARYISTKLQENSQDVP